MQKAILKISDLEALEAFQLISLIQGALTTLNRMNQNTDINQTIRMSKVTIFLLNLLKNNSFTQ